MIQIVAAIDRYVRTKTIGFVEHDALLDMQAADLVQTEVEQNIPLAVGTSDMRVADLYQIVQ